MLFSCISSVEKIFTEENRTKKNFRHDVLAVFFPILGDSTCRREIFAGKKFAHSPRKPCWKKNCVEKSIGLLSTLMIGLQSLIWQPNSQKQLKAPIFYLLGYITTSDGQRFRISSTNGVRPVQSYRFGFERYNDIVFVVVGDVFLRPLKSP